MRDPHPDLQSHGQTALEYLRAGAVSAETRKGYAQLFRDLWTPVCEQFGNDPDDAGPEMILELFRAARAGELRRPGKGNTRTGPVSAGYLDVILAAVRQRYLDSGKTPPQDQMGEQAFRDLRRGYKTLVAARERAISFDTPFLLEDLRRICSSPVHVNREHAVSAVAALLSLDEGVTHHELAELTHADVERSEDRLVISTAHRRIIMTCKHTQFGGIDLVCLKCHVQALLELPPVNGAALMATSDHHLPNAWATRTIVASRLRAATAPLRWLTVSGGHPGFKVEHEPAATPDQRIASRQAVALTPTKTSRLILQTRAAARLAAGRGLVPRDLFKALSVGDVRDLESRPGTSERPGAAAGLALYLPATVTAAIHERAWITVAAQPERDLCPVTALREWLLVRYAVQGNPLQPGEPVFIDTTRWGQGLGRPVTIQSPRKALIHLQQLAGLESIGTWESLRELWIATLVRQGASEVELIQTLRLAKPEHVTRAVARHSMPAPLTHGGPTS